MVTAANLLREMQSFVQVSATLIEKAEQNKMDDRNPEFATIVEGWSDGVYDEDPDYVVSEIESLLR